MIVEPLSAMFCVVAAAAAVTTADLSHWSNGPTFAFSRTPTYEAFAGTAAPVALVAASTTGAGCDELDCAETGVDTVNSASRTRRRRTLLVSRHPAEHAGAARGPFHAGRKGNAVERDRHIREAGHRE